MPVPIYRPVEPVPYTPAYELEDVLGSRGRAPQRFVLPAAATSLWPSLRSTDVAVLEAGTGARGQRRRGVRRSPNNDHGPRGASALRVPPRGEAAAAL